MDQLKTKVMYSITFTVLLAPGVVEDRLKPPHILHPAWIVRSDGKRTTIMMVTDQRELPRLLFHDIVIDFEAAFIGDDVPFWAPWEKHVEVYGYTVVDSQAPEQYGLLVKIHQPGKFPTWESDPSGKVKMTLTGSKKGSKIFQKPHVFEEITGSPALLSLMQYHMFQVKCWLANYDAYYSCRDWSYELKTKGLPTPA